MFTACFLIITIISVTIVVPVETVHDSFPFPAPEFQASVSLTLCHFLLFRVTIEKHQTQNTFVSLNFLEIHCHHFKIIHFHDLLSAKLSIALNFMFLLLLILLNIFIVLIFLLFLTLLHSIN